MNKRIKELAKQAEITLVLTEYTGCLSGQEFLVTDRNLTNIHLEKFAELIIRECAEFARQHNLEKADRSHMIHKAIREHFGVDQ